MLLLAAIVSLAAVWFTGDDRETRKRFLRLPPFHCRRRDRRFRFARSFFLLRLSRTRVDSDLSAHRHLGHGNRSRRGLENHNLSRVGSFILLLGLILLYRSVPAAARSFDLRVLQTAAGNGPDRCRTRNTIFICCCLIGFGILISLFPFHTWAPEAYASAPAPAAMLHAGVLKKFGLYGCCASPCRSCRKARGTGARCSSCCCSATSSTSAWSRSRRSGSIGCSVIRA